MRAPIADGVPRLSGDFTCFIFVCLLAVLCVCVCDFVSVCLVHTGAFGGQKNVSHALILG